jgi:hypothetical protein
MLVSEVTPPPSRRWIVAQLAATIGGAMLVGATLVLLFPLRLGATSPPAATAPSASAPAAPAPAAPAPAIAPAPAALIERGETGGSAPGGIDEPLVKIVAASDAPVIAVASRHRVWISRDDGKTFAPALHGAGVELGFELFVEPAGRVYALRSVLRDHRAANGVLYAGTMDDLAISELDGRERWRELTDGMVPWVAGDGSIAGVATGGVEIGRNAGDSWSFVPGSQGWNPWLIGLGDHGVVRFLASRVKQDDQLDSALSLVVARRGRAATAVWSMPVDGMPGVPSDEIPCAGFAGSTLHLVATDRKLGPRGTRLISIASDGTVRTRVPADLVAGVVLDPGMTCEIAGNERAAYLAVDHIVFRIDTRELQLSDHTSSDFRSIAVDAHGDLLVLARRCVRRLHAGSRREDELACGPLRD